MIGQGFLVRFLRGVSLGRKITSALSGGLSILSRYVALGGVVSGILGGIATKLLILDSLGCALYGADLPWTRILQQTLSGLEGGGQGGGVSVWGTPLRLSAPHAALVNGTQVQGFELDDVHRQGVLHVGAVVLPALLAVAEMRPGMSGREFLASAVAGGKILDCLRHEKRLAAEADQAS